MAIEQNEAAQQQEAEQKFAIQRIYMKDLSFEAPNAPAQFKSEWKPEMHLDINTNTKVLEEDVHDVVLTLTVTVKSQGKTAFLIEIKQGGIFALKGFPEQQLKHTLGSFCPSLLYPYARETVSSVVTKGGFPQLILAPINFDALYAQHHEQQKQTESQDDGDATH